MTDVDTCVPREPRSFFSLVIVTVAVACLGLALTPHPVNEAATRSIAVWIALGAIGLVLARAHVHRNTFVAGLLLLTALSTTNMLRWSAKRLEHIDHYDVGHYYLGAKYAHELGPFDLYPCVALVDHEHEPWANPVNKYWAQTRDGFERQPLTHAIDRGKLVRQERFSPQRWQRFEHDTLYLRGAIGKRSFRKFLNDKGFNATPAWIAYARPLADWVAVESIQWLVALDALLLALTLVAVGWTFGWVPALFGGLFLSTSVTTQWLIPGCAFLRYDWLCGVVLGMCALRRGHPAAAGALTAFAAAMRIFPAVFMFGPICQLVFRRFRQREGAQNKRTRSGPLMLAGFVATLLTVEICAVSSVGLDTTIQQAEKIRHHTSVDMMSTNRPGLAVAMVYDGTRSPTRIKAKHRKAITQQAPLRLTIALAVLALLGWSLRHKSAHEAFAYGYVPFFLLATGHYYYHVARLTLVVLHASELSTWRNRVGLCLLLTIEAHGLWARSTDSDQLLYWTGWSSWGLASYCLVMTAILLDEDRRGQALEPGHVFGRLVDAMRRRWSRL